MRVWVILCVSLWSAIICEGAPQGAGDGGDAGGDAGSGEAAPVDMTEATELITFLRDMVK